MSSTESSAVAAPFTEDEREAFIRHYAVAALWSSTDESGRPLDDSAAVDDIDADTAATMREDCNDFIDSNLQALRDSGLGLEQMGTDFWLTRNGHGAGFWDRGIGKVGATLTAAAKVYSSFTLMRGADGKVISMAG